MSGAATAPMANTANCDLDSGGAISSAVPTCSMSSRKLAKNSCMHDITWRNTTGHHSRERGKEQKHRIDKKKERM